MSELVPFQFHGHDVPAIRDDHGDPWWKAADVCEHCDIKNISKACERLDADEKAVITLSDSAGRPQDMLVINEAGLYALVLSSRKPEAKVFKRWITHDVIPSIRKTGKYEAPQVKNPANQLMIDAVIRIDQLEQVQERYAEQQALQQAALLAHQTKLIATQQQAIDALTQSARAESKVDRALDTQQRFTVAEYVKFEHLGTKIPDNAFRALSDHLQSYCMNNRIPFRRTPVAGKPWPDEYEFHISVYDAAFPGWLSRRYAQTELTVLPGGA